MDTPKADTVDITFSRTVVMFCVDIPRAVTVETRAPTVTLAVVLKFTNLVCWASLVSLHTLNDISPMPKSASRPLICMELLLTVTKAVKLDGLVNVCLAVHVRVEPSIKNVVASDNDSDLIPGNDIVENDMLSVPSKVAAPPPPPPPPAAGVSHVRIPAPSVSRC